MRFSAFPSVPLCFRMPLFFRTLRYVPLRSALFLRSCAFSYVPIHAPFPHVPMPVQAFRSVSLCHCVPTRSSALRFVLIFSFFPLRSHPRPFSWGFEMFRRVSMCSAAFPCIRLSFTRSNAFSCLVPILSYASSSIIPLRFSRVLLFAISSGAFPALFKRFVAFPCIELHFNEFQYVSLSCDAFPQHSAAFLCLPVLFAAFPLRSFCVLLPHFRHKADRKSVV